MQDFSFSGNYRVQSRRDTAPSRLEGVWLHSRKGLLDSDSINRALRMHPQWEGNATVTMRPALVTQRSGKFANEPDILYKRDFFESNPGSAPMDVDIVDVLKSCAHWKARIQYAKQIFSGKTWSRLVRQMDNLHVIVANEYYVHEAGHFIGYDVLAKYADGYFSPAGKTAWSLIYLEELRADLQGFGFGADLLDPDAAASILLYNIALRFGVHFEGVSTRNIAPYGLTPYLLFCVLRDVGYISIVKTRSREAIRLASLEANDIVSIMRECARHAASKLTSPELSVSDPIERAILAAAYVRQRLEDTASADAYASIMRHKLMEM